MLKTENEEWLEKSTALIRFSKEEMQNLIVALVISEKCAETMSNYEYEVCFRNLRNDIIKIKNDLIKKEELYEEETIKRR
tara:strand:+ start:79 stop:318 length:240 start_codon:yes stop_codon:yes gene_type:complete